MRDANWHARHLKRAGVLVFLLLLPTLSACAEALPSAEPVTITFAYDVEGDGDGREYYEALVESFHESHPDITVELATPGEDEADVLIISPFDLSDQLEEGAVLSLDPFIERDEDFDLSDFYPGTVGLFTMEGKLWAIPAAVDVMVLYYNQDLFDAYGVAYPEPGWTWEDFLDKAIDLRDPDASVFAYVPVDEFLEPLPFIYQHGGKLIDDPQHPTRTTFDDPLTIEAMEWYAALIFDHNVAPTQSQMHEIDGIVEIGVYKNQVAMWIDWLSEHGGGRGESGDPDTRWPGEWKMRWGMVPLPRDAQTAALAYAAGYAISSESEHLDASWQWIEFLSQQVWTPYGLAPARKSIAESAEYERRVGADVAAIGHQAMEESLLISTAWIEFVPLDLYGQAVNRIINGYATPQEALTEAQQQAERRMGE